MTFFGSWHSTNPTIATIDNYGKLTALSQGVTYIYKTYDGINSDSVLITVSSSTQINHYDNSLSKLFYYPNPVSDELIIEIINNTEKINFEVLNTIGQVVFKGNFVKKTTVPTNNFAPGVYLIKLENGNTVEFKKLIKK